MKRTRGHAALALASLVSSLIACAGGDEASPPRAAAPAPTATSTTPPPPGCTGSACDPPPVTEPLADPLRVRFFGVDGFLLELGNEAVMTVPLFTRPSMVEA